VQVKTHSMTSQKSNLIRIFGSKIQNEEFNVPNVIHCVPKNVPLFIGITFWNNSVKNKLISIIFDTQIPEET